MRDSGTVSWFIRALLVSGFGLGCSSGEGSQAAPAQSGSGGVAGAAESNAGAAGSSTTANGGIGGGGTGNGGAGNGGAGNGGASNAEAGNSGACGDACPVRAHADNLCAVGKCHHACVAGYLDCNGDLGFATSDGCEVAGYSCNAAVLVSSRNGTPGNRGSNWLSISQNGRFVVFDSEATNFADGEPNNFQDVFLFDRLTGEIEKISVSSAGEAGNQFSWYPDVSADGRFIVFSSMATNLVPGDTNGVADVFLRDRHSKTTLRVSVGAEGEQGLGESYAPRISADGRRVVFPSEASNLVVGDTNEKTDIFLRDLTAQTTTRVSVSQTSQQGTENCTAASISGNGELVVFATKSALVASDHPTGQIDVFLRDILNSTTRRISVDSVGNPGNGTSMEPVISADGKFVAFTSLATNLVADDSNARRDVFLHDIAQNKTTRVSFELNGTQTAVFHNSHPTISGDGTKIGFLSATHDGALSGVLRIFNRGTGITQVAALNSRGVPMPELTSDRFEISDDGTAFAFGMSPGAARPAPVQIVLPDATQQVFVSRVY